MYFSGDIYFNYKRPHFSLMYFNLKYFIIYFILSCYLMKNVMYISVKYNEFVSVNLKYFSERFYFI